VTRGALMASHALARSRRAFSQGRTRRPSGPSPVARRVEAKFHGGGTYGFERRRCGFLAGWIGGFRGLGLDCVVHRHDEHPTLVRRPFGLCGSRQPASCQGRPFRRGHSRSHCSAPTRYRWLDSVHSRRIESPTVITAKRSFAWCQTSFSLSHDKPPDRPMYCFSGPTRAPSS